MKIGILFGGNSYEHNISISTAIALKNKLKQYYPKLLYLSKDNIIYEVNNIKDVNSKIKGRKINLKKSKIDLIILALHGQNAEDGLGCAISRLNKIPYVGSDLFTSSLCMDKYLSYLYLSKYDINMLNTTLFNKDIYLNGNYNFDFPVIFKPRYGGSSIGIYIINNIKELKLKIREMFDLNDEYIVQKYYENILELNIAKSSNYISNLEQINYTDKYFSFEEKYTNEFKLSHKIIKEHNNEIITMIDKCYNLINAKGIVRFDIFKIDNIYYLNEINTTPGSLAMYLFDDFNKVIEDEINIAKKIDYSIKNYNKNIKNKLKK